MSPALTKHLLLTAIAIAATFACATAPRAETAQEVLTASDRVRNPSVSFTAINTVTEFRSGVAQDAGVLVVFSKEDKSTGQFRSLAGFRKPERDAGKLIMRSGNDLWFYDPAARSAVRISPQQRLLGQASNGDVVTVNFARDYNAKIVAEEESVTDADHQQRGCWKLELVAANDTVSYARVEYWVEKKTFHPVKARFYSDSGRLLKTAFYRRFSNVLGAMRPTEAVIIDGVDTTLVTRMAFDNWREQEIPENWFQREFLPRIQLAR